MSLVPVKVEKETRSLINKVGQKQNMTQAVVVGHVFDLNEKHDFFDGDWRLKIAEAEFSEVLDKRHDEERKALNIQTHRQMLKTKSDLLVLYVKALDKDSRRAFLEGVLGDLKSQNFLDNVVNYQLFVIDGKNRACQPDAQGKPILTGVDPSLIVSCEKGFHVLEAWCQCEIWRRCPIRQKEYESYLVEHGSEADRRKYLEDKNR